MKVTALSDCHGLLLPIEEFEPCELVCICGDISPLNIQANHKKTIKLIEIKYTENVENILREYIYSEQKI